MDNNLSEEKIYKAALDWETSRIHTIEKSERRAWTIAFIAVAVTVLAWLSIVIMLPLKEKVPYVIRVNNATGVPDIITVLQDQKIKYDDVMDKYWLSQYVRAHETYDWYTLQKDYNAVGLLSSPQVGAEYAKLFQGEKALDKVFNNNIRTLVEIVSVVPNGKGIATVRFIKHSKQTNQQTEGESSNWVATISYEYRNPSVMKESIRLINPFGFQVLSYRVDPEVMEGEIK
jgi:type IV secretory pathway component VirB8